MGMAAADDSLYRGEEAGAEVGCGVGGIAPSLVMLLGPGPRSCCVASNEAVTLAEGEGFAGQWC